MIVVLGAFGKTGRAAAAHLELLTRGPVRRVTRDVARTSRAAGHETVQARLSDESELRAALKGARAVYALLPDDLAAPAFRAERRAMVEAMTSAIRHERVPRVVLISSALAALGEDAQNGFGADLAYFERLLANSGAALSILRASYFQDNVATLLPALAHDGVYPNFFGSRTQALPTIAARDVGHLAAQVLFEPAANEVEIVDLVGPSYSVNEMATAAGAALGRALTVVDVPLVAQAAAFAQWMSAEAASAMVETLAVLSSGAVYRQGTRVRVGESRLEQVLRAALTHAPRCALEVQP